jgi:hypothetical protein
MGCGKNERRRIVLSMFFCGSSPFSFFNDNGDGTVHRAGLFRLDWPYVPFPEAEERDFA